MSSVENLTYQEILGRFNGFREYKNKLTTINNTQIEINKWAKIKSKNTSQYYKTYTRVSKWNVC